MRWGIIETSVDRLGRGTEIDHTVETVAPRGSTIAESESGGDDHGSAIVTRISSPTVEGPADELDELLSDLSTLEGETDEERESHTDGQIDELEQLFESIGSVVDENAIWSDDGTAEACASEASDTTFEWVDGTQLETVQ